MKKKLLIVALVVLMFTSTAVSFAYWLSDVGDTTENADISITIGQAETVVGKIDATVAPITEKLVPSTVTPRAINNETTSLEVEITVKWLTDDTSEGDIAGRNGKLTISDHEFTIGTEADDANLFSVSFDAAEYAIVGDNASGVVVTATITMTEPADKAQYDRIAGEDLTLYIEFTVVETA